MSENEISVYPNPSKDYFIVDLKNNSINNSVIILYDVLGKEVKRQKISESKTNIQHDLQKGIYFYTVSSDSEKIQSGKLVVQ
ncbi:MAG: T9SS type A sorting domain-containing protein [Sphingobacteriaceae bacterium]|nr:T9SS type A sorting domain-containing protein [Sphingobacteriaceae bacterium]